MTSASNHRFGIVGIAVVCAAGLLLTGCDKNVAPAPSEPINASPPTAQSQAPPTAQSQAPPTAQSQAPSGDYPLSVCVVTGNALGMMGKPVSYQHEGREVKFCCNNCIAKFEAAPAKYLAKLDAANGV